MKKQLLIDCSFIKADIWVKGSLALYAVRLLQGFRDNDVFDVTAIVWKGFESFIDDSAGYKVPKIIIDEHHYVTPWPFVDRILGLISFKRELRDRKIDIVLSPYHFECRLFFPKKYHQHAVVHDLFLYDSMKEMVGRYHYLAWRLYYKLLHKKIAHFISISEETRQELKRIEGRRSDVVYNSIPIDFSFQEELVSDVKDKLYILDVNTFQKRKNPETLIRAFSLIKERIPHMLYLKGDKFFVKEYDDLMKIVMDEKMQDRVYIDCTYRSVGEMRYLYRHADLFVTPSLQEGFGWTPIEAAIMGAPVLVSDINVLKEVTCEKVPTFDPYSVEDLAEKMLAILKNPPSRESREELSRFYQEKYSLKRQIDSLTELFLRNLKVKQM